MDRSLRIAHCVESYAPALGGMAEVVRQLSERMVRVGHHVTVLTSKHPDRHASTLNGVEIRAFDVKGNALSGITGQAEVYVQALKDGAFDVVVFFAAQQWATDAVLPHLHAIKAKKVFVPTGFSGLHNTRWSAYYQRMPEHLAAMDLCVFHTENYQDVRFAREHGITKHVLIPNGAAEEEFGTLPAHDMRSELGIKATQPMILHVGSYTGAKGQKEAIQLFLQADTQDAMLVLIGNGNAALKRLFEDHWRYFIPRWKARLKNKRILFLECDRSRTVSAMKQADLFLFPSLIECSPIVLFESVASGVPFLSSDAGNSAEIASWTHGGWIMRGSKDAAGFEVPDIKAGAAQLSDLLRDRSQLKAAGAAGKAAWKANFTWQRIAQRYTEEYQRLIDAHHG